MAVRILLLACCAAVAGAGLRAQGPGRPAEAPPLAEQRLVLEAAGPLELGAAPPPPVWAAWRRGAPIDGGAAEAPPCTVFAFYPWPREVSGPDADGDADCLVDLQRRFAARGVRVVAAIADPELPLGDAWGPCSIVLDAGQRTARAWGVTGEPDRHVVALDRLGRTVFQGEPGGGLVDAIEAACAGTFDATAAQRSAELRYYFRERFDDVVGAEVGPAVEKLLRQAPRDGFAWGIAYLVAATKLADAEQALAIRKRAVDALANEARPLAVFADLALRGDPRAVGLATGLAAALQPATAAAPRDPFVQLAYLRALVLADKGREVGRHAARTGRLAAASARHDLEFAAILTQATTPPVHRDLAEQAVQRAERRGAPARSVTAVKYLVASRCAEDAAAASGLVAAHVAELGGRIAVNNDCWYLMTQLSTMGRYDGFAVALAERMLEDRQAMDYFEFDTAALAMFLVGRFADAADLQEAAIQGGGQGNPDYAERLRRYRAAAAAARR